MSTPSHQPEKQPRAAGRKARTPQPRSSVARIPTQPSPSPARKQRTVLITVSGMSPAILTETVWALAHPGDGEKPIVPDEVVVITTTKGAADLKRDLLTPSEAFSDRTVWASLRDVVREKATHASADVLQLAGPRVIELPDPNSGVKRQAEDIRSLDDNIAAANFILEEIRRHVENPETRVIASIAGGRKTMGALLYAAMSLIGRETDRVTHVLVNEPFEVCRGFFFPGQPNQNLTAGPKEKQIHLRARDAKIDLADIPFVPLRNRFTELAELPGRFTSLVDRYARQLKSDATRKVPIVIDYARRRLGVDGVEIPMRSRALSVLNYFLQRQQEKRPPLMQKAASDDFKTWQALTPHADQFKFGNDTEFFRHELNHLRTMLRKQGCNWNIPVRSLVFPPCKLTVV